MPETPENAPWHLAPSGTSRPLAPRTLWHLAPFGTLRLLAVRALDVVSPNVRTGTLQRRRDRRGFCTDVQHPARPAHGGEVQPMAELAASADQLLQDPQLDRIRRACAVAAARDPAAPLDGSEVSHRRCPLSDGWTEAAGDQHPRRGGALRSDRCRSDVVLSSCHRTRPVEAHSLRHLSHGDAILDTWDLVGSVAQGPPDRLPRRREGRHRDLPVDRRRRVVFQMADGDSPAQGGECAAAAICAAAWCVTGQLAFTLNS